MKFKRRFYDSSINFKNISLKRFVLGIAIGLVSAFTIYSFFYVIRESFRVMSLGFNDYGFWSFQEEEFILTKSDRNFYNIFFSGLSLIFGNSIALLFVFSRPNKVINKFDSRRKRLLNDQVFLSFNFCYWFTKIGLVFGVFSMCCMDFDFLPYFKPLAFLLLIVLYLETWKNLAFIIKKKRFKVQLFHLIIVLSLTYGLSKIDIVDYKSIDKASLFNNPKIEFPSSDFFSTNNHYLGRNLEIAFKLKLNESNNLEIYTEYRERINLEDVAYYISSERASRREELIPFLSVRILADEGLNIKNIKTFEAELYSAGVYKVHYEVYNKHLYETYFENGTIQKRLNKSILEFKVNNLVKNDTIELIQLPPLRLTPPEIDYAFRDTIMIVIHKKLKMEEKPVSIQTISEEFKKTINTKTLFLYKINKETTYQDYINVLSAHNKAIHELREREQTIFIDSEYNYTESYRKEQLKLKEKYPIRIIEKME